MGAERYVCSLMKIISMILPAVKLRFGNHLLIFFIVTLHIVSIRSFSQSSFSGDLKGIIYNGSSGQALGNIKVLIEKDSQAATYADGHYHLQLPKGKHTLKASANGFQTRFIENVPILIGETTRLDLFLFPIARNFDSIKIKFVNDSVGGSDSVATISFLKAVNNNKHHPLLLSHNLSDLKLAGNIEASIDKNASFLLRRFNNVSVYDTYSNPHLQTLTINGLGDRYNQVLFNNLPLNSFDPSVKSYALKLIPVEAIESVSVQTIADGTINADFSGGTVNIKTKDLPQKNFLFIQGGLGLYNTTNGETFLTDKYQRTQWLGFSGKIRNLPKGFPTTRSRVILHELNLQEQIGFSKQMKNNLTPVSNSTSVPNNRILIGFGKLYKLKNGSKLGIIGYLHQQKIQLIDATEVQASPNIAINPYPFSNTSSPLIRSFSMDTTFRFLSEASGIINISYINKRSRFSFKNFLGGQFINNATKRSQILKPDEDTAAHFGIHYLSVQRKFINSQLTGEHILSDNQSFKLNWQIGYQYYNQKSPDERNILLSQNPSNESEFRIATQSQASLLNDATIFANTGRSWKHLNDHNFNADINFSVPFNFLGLSQHFSGGLFMQTNYRVSYSDLFLVTQKNSNYYLLGQVMAPERYSPDGLTINNFYKKLLVTELPQAIFYSAPSNLGNYTGSSNTGAAYIQISNKLRRKIKLTWGVRLESVNQLVSNTQYQYQESFEKPQVYTISLNSRVAKLNALPNIKLSYAPLNTIQVTGSYSRTVLRPQLQELANYRVYHPLSFLIQQGNPLLENAAVENFAAVLSWIPAANTSLSVTGYYKTIDRPIENIVTNYSTGNLLITPRNTPDATILGLQATLELNLSTITNTPFFRYLSLFANGNINRSDVSGGPVKGDYNIGQRTTSTIFVQEHTLTGSPGYTINTGLIINHPKWPNLSVLFQQTADYKDALGSGNRITLINGKTISTTPDYRVAERNQLDIQISQKFFKSTVKFIAGINNLLENGFVQYQDLNGNKKFDTPLTLSVRNNGAYFQSGMDNTITNNKSQRLYYITLSYLFK